MQLTQLPDLSRSSRSRLWPTGGCGPARLAIAAMIPDIAILPSTTCSRCRCRCLLSASDAEPAVRELVAAVADVCPGTPRLAELGLSHGYDVIAVLRVGGSRPLRILSVECRPRGAQQTSGNITWRLLRFTLLLPWTFMLHSLPTAS